MTTVTVIHQPWREPQPVEHGPDRLGALVPRQLLRRHLCFGPASPSDLRSLSGDLGIVAQRPGQHFSQLAVALVRARPTAVRIFGNAVELPRTTRPTATFDETVNEPRLLQDVEMEPDRRQVQANRFGERGGIHGGLGDTQDVEQTPT